MSARGGTEGGSPLTEHRNAREAWDDIHQRITVPNVEQTVDLCFNQQEQRYEETLERAYHDAVTYARLNEVKKVGNCPERRGLVVVALGGRDKLSLEAHDHSRERHHQVL